MSQPAPSNPPGPKAIATLPPIEELHDEVPVSPRTGEPRRPWTVLLGAVAAYLGATALTFAYGWHWWRAVYPNSYAVSSRLVQWVDPDPGKWLSLTLEGVLAAALVVAAGAVGVAGFQAWNGWRWARWASLVAVVLAAGFALVLNALAWLGVGLALITAVTSNLPLTAHYFTLWDRVRAERPAPYRRPSWIFYGRLPRFR